MNIERMLRLEQERPQPGVLMCRDTLFWIDGHGAWSSPETAELLVSGQVDK
jgi:hypothetical protein